MKRFFMVLLIILVIPITTFGQTDDYISQLNEYDLSVFSDKLDKDTYGLLKDLGLDDFDYDTITSLSINDFINIVKNLIEGKLSLPLKCCSIVMAFVILSALFQSFKSDGDESFSEIYSTVTGLVISIFLVKNTSTILSMSAMSISIVADFIYGFFPVFGLIIATSSNIATSISTNTLLLSLAQGLNFLSANVFVPLINCFLALSICSSLRYELHLYKLIENAKKCITVCISFCAAAFVSILSIKTAVASKADAIGLRSIRFAINSVVPVIGSAISEGLLSIQSYSSLIKSSVGVVGIISVFLVFLPSIFGVVAWRFCLGICNIVSEIFDDKTVCLVIKSFQNVLLLINVVLILSMVTTIISIGILIAAGG